MKLGPIDPAVCSAASGTAREPGRDGVALRKAAEAFEAMLVQTLVRRMAEAQLEEGFFGGGAGASVYEGLFEQHLAEGVAGRSPLGIADLLEARWTARGTGSAAGKAAARLRQEAAALDGVLGAGAAFAAPQVPSFPADEKLDVEGLDAPRGGQR